MTQHRKVGAQGEALVCKYLQKQGYSLVCTNYSSRYGEIDIVAQKCGIIAFVEVKTRNAKAFVNGWEAVTPAKQKKIKVTAGLYLQTYPTAAQPRFDVAAVIYQYGEYTIDYLEAAFE